MSTQGKVAQAAAPRRKRSTKDVLAQLELALEGQSGYDRIDAALEQVRDQGVRFIRAIDACRDVAKMLKGKFNATATGISCDEQAEPAEVAA